MSEIASPIGLESGRFSEGASPGQRTLFGNTGYGVILADPPWRFETRSERGQGRSPSRHYDTMTPDQIAALPVAALAARDCALFMWAVDSLLPAALEIGRAWGFTYKTVGFYWAKCAESDASKFPIGTGYWGRANPEQCLLFTRGSPRRLDAGVPKLIVAPRREHSRKPGVARTRIQRLVGGPYLELFARDPAPGWDSWGAQIDRFATGEAA